MFIGPTHFPISENKLVDQYFARMYWKEPKYFSKIIFIKIQTR